MTELAVALDDDTLVGSQLARVEEDVIRDRDLAEVVQRRGLAYERDAARRQAQLGRDQRAIRRHSFDVMTGGVVAQLDGAGEPAHRLPPRAAALADRFDEPCARRVQ